MLWGGGGAGGQERGGWPCRVLARGGRGMQDTADYGTYIYIRTGALLTDSCCSGAASSAAGTFDRNQLIMNCLELRLRE
jgi:hypothetical protein